ncbi:hypothetical protein BGLA2_150023 [Burkholderia gladioli]|nr:hypothetical protein BGLA2_150023 [Burkholderia gladioli]
MSIANGSGTIATGSADCSNAITAPSARRSLRKQATEAPGIKPGRMDSSRFATRRLDPAKRIPA